MKKRTGKMISLSLAVALAVTAAPVTALADESVQASTLTTAQNTTEPVLGTTLGEQDEEGNGSTEKSKSAKTVATQTELETALTEASEDDTITITTSFEITKSIVIDKAVTVTANEGVVLKAKGDFSAPSFDPHVFRLYHADAVLDNVTVVIDESNSSNVNIVYLHAGTVQNCNFTGSGATDSPVTRGVMVESGAKNVVIKDNVFNGFFASAYINSGATGDIIDNESKNTEESWCIADGSNMDLTGNTFEGTTTIDIKIFADSPIQTNNYTKEKFLAMSENNSSARIQNIIDDVTALDGSIIVSDKDSLEKAIAYADATETPIALQNDITGDFVIGTDKNVSLDLNGHKITNESDHTITNNGTLTIKDSSEGKTGTITNSTHGKGALVNNYGGTVDIESGTLTREEATDNSWYVISNDGTMNIKGGSIINKVVKLTSSLIRNEGEMDISGGYLEHDFIAVKNDDTGKGELSTLTVSGDVVIKSPEQAIQNWTTAVISGGTMNGKVSTWGYNGQCGNTEITGGTINGNITIGIDKSNLLNSSKIPEVTISNGTINGDIEFLTGGTSTAAPENTKGSFVINNGVTINGDVKNPSAGTVEITDATVTGTVSNTGSGSMAVTESKVGSYDENNTIIFIDSSKMDGTLIPDSDIGNAVAMIGATTYDTFDAAIAAAKSGQTIRLMKNVEVNHAVTIPAGVTLDGGKNTTITLTAELANGAFITASGDNVTIQNITIDTNENAKHGVQFYCVKGGEMDKVTVNGGYFTSVIVNGAEATIKNSILNLDEGQGYTNIEFAVGSGVTTVPKVTIENVTVTPNRPVVYMDKTTFDRIQALYGTSGITRDELNKQYVKGAFLYYNKDGSITPNPDTLPTITFDPTEGSIADSAKTQKINTSGHLDSLPTASRSGYRLDGWYTETEGGEKITTDTLFTEDTTVYAQWSKKSSSSSRYDGYITIINPKNGEVSVSDDWAYEDDKITLTITPDDGYEVDKIEIVDDEGDKIDAKKVEDKDNKYTFRMANCDVTVTVTFKEEGKTTEDTDKEEDKDDETTETTKLNFTDVKESDWFFKGVEYVVDKGVMSGVSENQFDPSGKLTRAMLVQMLYNMESRPACDAENAFMDVPVGQWYTDAVIWANDEKIVSGMGDGLFAPNMEISREQMVVMLYNYAKYKGYDVTASADLSAFADTASVSAWAQPAMQWAVAEGYISGMGDNQLAPQGTATRAEIASVIMRFMEATAESAETAE